MTHADTNAPERSRKKPAPRRTEYTAYFAVIFMTAVPFALVAWALAQVGIMDTPEHGPIKSAWSQASIITPKIFWA
ncbi:MAG: cytochrome PufQ [Roseovarius sp.]